LKRVIQFTALSFALVPDVSRSAVFQISHIRAPASTRYFVVFSARPAGVELSALPPEITYKSETGHSFVSWGVEDKSRGLSWQSSFGYYPRKGVGLLATVPGEIRAESFANSVHEADKLLIVETTEDEFNLSRAVKKSWTDNDRGYRATVSDCNSFSEAVARSVGLKIPTQPPTLPEGYVDALIELNRLAPSISDLTPTWLRKKSSPATNRGSSGDEHSGPNIDALATAVRNLDSHRQLETRRLDELSKAERSERADRNNAVNQSVQSSLLPPGGRAPASSQPRTQGPTRLPPTESVVIPSNQKQKEKCPKGAEHCLSTTVPQH
jgi:hypothetical protein